MAPRTYKGKKTNVSKTFTKKIIIKKDHFEVLTFEMASKELSRKRRPTKEK
jgi:hypothetical protein